jgi:hypothetical protein
MSAPEISDSVWKAIAAVAAPLSAAIGFFFREAVDWLRGARNRKKEAVAKLRNLKELVDESWYVDKTQRVLVRQLHSLLEKRLGRKVPTDVGYDQTFFLLYDDMNEEEMELFKVIRTMTTRSTNRLNEALRQWAVENTPSRLGLPSSPATQRFDKNLNKMKLHLDLYFERYNLLFSNSERRSLMYMQDLGVPGVPFPEDLDKSLAEVLGELK